MDNTPIAITFCGHKEVSNESSILNQLVKQLEVYFDVAPNLAADTHLIFYCGGYGSFDSLAAKSIDILKKKYPFINAEKIFVTPYITPSYRETIDLKKKLFDDVVYPPLEDVPPKYAISRRNEWMVDQSTIIYAYVVHSWGGAATTLAYAKHKHKQIIYITD